MKKEEWEQLMYEQDHRLLVKKQLPDHDELLGTLRALIPTTGNVDELFCNAFFSESVELLKHAFFYMRMAILIVHSTLCGSR